MATYTDLKTIEKAAFWPVICIKKTLTFASRESVTPRKISRILATDNKCTLVKDIQ